jgi:hypothetical protein
MNKQEFDLWINTDEGKAIAGPYFDSKVGNAIKTYQSKHPTKDNLGLILDEIEKKIANKDLEARANDLRFFAYKRCIENNVDYELLEGFNFDNEESISNKIDQLAVTQSKLSNQMIHEKLASTSKPKSGQQRETPIKDANYYLLQAEERDRQSR